MGLSGRKIKQRLEADPRNLTWSDDSSRFGAKYLQSLGWTSGTGLGASGEGRVSNLKVHQKLDLMGIGGNRRAPDGDEAGWKGGREFEGLLARLNRTQSENVDEDGSAPVVVEDTHKSTVADEQVRDDTQSMTEDGEILGRKRKRGHDGEVDTKEAKRRQKERKRLEKEKRKVDGDEEIDAKEAKRRQKEQKRLEKEKRRAEKRIKKLKATKDDPLEPPQPIQTCTDILKTHPSATSVNVKPTPPSRAHRAKHLAFKRMAAASSTSMKEILGISSAPSDSAHTPLSRQDSPLNTPSADDRDVQQKTNDTPYEKPSGLGSFSNSGFGLGFRGSEAKTQQTSNETTDLIRKSEKSMTDYFSEKMLLKMGKKKIAE